MNFLGLLPFILVRGSGSLQVVPAHSDYVLSVGQYSQMLSRELGKRVSVAKNLSSEVVFVDCGRVELSAKLKGLAVALHATVEPTGGGYLLKQTPENLVEAAALRTKKRSAWIIRALKEAQEYRETWHVSSDPSNIVAAIRQELQNESDRKKPGAVDHGSSVTSSRYLLPAMGLLERLLEAIGIQRIASIPTGESALFEIQASPFASELPKMDQWMPEYTNGVLRLQALSVNADLREKVKGFVDLQTLLTPTEGGMAPAFARVHLNSQPTSISASLELYDRLGTLIDSAHFLAISSTNMISGQSLASASLREKKEVPVSISPQEQEAANFILGKSSVTRLPWLQHPEQQEPLSLLVDKAMKADEGTEFEGREIAVLPDSALKLAATCCRNGVLDAHAFKILINSAEIYDDVDLEGVRIFKPVDPNYVVGSRSDRKRLGRFLTAIADSGSLDTRELAKLYAQSAPTTSTWIRSWPYYVAMNSGDYRGNLGLTEGVLSLIGAIDDSDWARLLSGTVLTSGQLGVENEILRLFREDSVSSLGQGHISDLRRHPSDLYNNLSAEAIPISVRTESHAVVQTKYQDRIAPLWQTRDEWIKSSMPLFDPASNPIRLREDRNQFEARQGKIGLFRFGIQTTVQLFVNLPDGLYLLIPLPPTTAITDDFKPYAELPDDFRNGMWSSALENASRIKLSTGQSTPDVATSSGSGSRPPH